VSGWVGLPVAVGGFTHPFLSFNHYVVAVGLVVLAAGYAGVGAALLRMANDEFDLAPTPVASRSSAHGSRSLIPFAMPR
jgi:hypothetical protein